MLAHPIVKCTKPLAANASAAPLDVVKMKSALGALGHYEAPEWGVSQFPDVALFDAIKAFQKSQGLKVDGMIKPDGETEAALSQAMTPRRAQTALQATAQALQSLGRGGDELLAHITKEEAALLHRVTDGATINPQTGLLEFWHDYEGEAAGVGSSSQNTGPDATDDGRGQGSGPNDYEYEAYNSTPRGPTDKKDGFGDSDNGAKGGGVNGQSVGGNASEGLTGTTQKEDKTKTDADRRSRGLGQTVNVGGLLDPKAEDDEEDALDWDPSWLGDDVEVPSAAPRTNTPTVDPNAQTDNNPAPKSNNGGKVKKDLNFFESIVEDLGDIFSGKAKGRYHSAQDMRNAKSLKAKYGGTLGDYLRGGDYGPGGGYYSPNGNYDAQLRNRVEGSGLTTSKSAENIPGLLDPGHPDYVAVNALDDLNAAFEAEAQKTQKENRQRMADIDKARQRTRLAAARMKELDRIRDAQALETPKDILSRGVPVSGSLAPQDRPAGRTLDQKAADVGEQPMGSQTSQTSNGPVDTGTLVDFDSFAEWRDANLVVDVAERKAELRHKIANQELEVQAAQRQRAEIQAELERANALAHPLEDSVDRSLLNLGAGTALGAARGASGGVGGAALGGLKGAATSGVKSYDAYSQLDELMKEIGTLRSRVSWYDKYVAEEQEMLRSYYDELEQME